MSQARLHIDIETFSSADIRSSGAYRYTQAVDFQILLVAYAFNDEAVQLVDLASGERLPERFTSALRNPEIIKMAHNAVFERQAFAQWGFDVPVEQWHCSAIKAAYCGLPLSLAGVSAALRLDADGKAKLKTGRELIKYFCVPCKPTKANGKRNRNYPHHDPAKWAEFGEYCRQDVEAEREVHNRLAKYVIPEWERQNYILDQKINDRGVLLDLDLADNAVKIDNQNTHELKTRAKEITGLQNPNSPAQLKKWFSARLSKDITTLDKAAVKTLLGEVDAGPVRDMLELRQRLGKSSTKKYAAMPACAGFDNRARGLLQFYGASRTGRWAGRLIQLQNLPQNHLPDLEDARDTAKFGSPGYMQAKYPDVSKTLSQLIRTALIAPEGMTFAVADFSAIEARVLAWIANERWRMDVFNGDGKIYEASAAAMFNVDIKTITKGSPLRVRGKVSELALGYGGGKGALATMETAVGIPLADQMSDYEREEIKRKWRKASPAIVSFWYEVEDLAKKALRHTGKVFTGGALKNLRFQYDGTALRIKLPSGRCLFYYAPKFGVNKFGSEALLYRGTNSASQWVYLDTYGGKLTENIVQAVARDLLAHSMQELDKAGFNIVCHVHDEAFCEVPMAEGEDYLQTMCDIMAVPPSWAATLPLGADGYVTPFYKKD